MRLLATSLGLKNSACLLSLRSGLPLCVLTQKPAGNHTKPAENRWKQPWLQNLPHLHISAFLLKHILKGEFILFVTTWLASASVKSHLRVHRMILCVCCRWNNWLWQQQRFRASLPPTHLSTFLSFHTSWTVLLQFESVKLPETRRTTSWDTICNKLSCILEVWMANIVWQTRLRHQKA